jgi:dTDP-L-rhamnose 4-epimerase
MNILITGGAGFIGSHTADALLKKGHHVRILDILKKPVHMNGFPEYLDKTKVEFIFGDVTNKSTLTYALGNVDIVYHLAAYQDYLPDYSSFSLTNVASTSLIYEIIEEHNLPIKKVILASSQAVMGEGKYHTKEGKVVFPSLRSLKQLSNAQWDLTDPETDLPLIMDLSDENVINPMNPYAMSKYQQEMLAINLGNRINIPSVAMRFSIVQGSRQSFYNAYSGACRIFSLSYFLNRQPTLYEDGNSIRDFVNIHDVVDALVLVMEKDEANGQVYNVGGGHPYTVVEFANTVAEVFGSDLAPKIPNEYRFGDTRHIFSDIGKLKSLGWVPKRTILDSIKEYKQYLEQQTDINDILDYSEKYMKNLGVVRRANR